MEQNVKKTLIISAFPGCGKTYLCENQDKLKFQYYGEDKRFSFLGSDSSHYKKCEGWEKEYIDDIEKKIGSVDFLFISQHEEVLTELESRNIPFIVIAPDNSEWLSNKERLLIKQQWFGRFVLRNNDHISNFDNWITSLKNNYDEWTSTEHLTKHNPISFFVLKENQYLSDIIKSLYWRKETYPCYVWHELILEDDADDDYEVKNVKWTIS